MILCPNCRAPNPDSFRFCGRCGKPLREEKAEEPPKGEQVPSWLRELGKGMEVGPGPALRGEEVPAEEGAGLPPWLAEAPAEEGAGFPPWLAEAPAEEGAGLPPWLAEAPAEVPAEEGAGLPPWPAEAPAEEGAGLPPWLAEAPAEVPAEEGVGLPPWLAEAPAEEGAGLPPWLAEAPAEEGAGLPPWLAEAPAEVPAEEGAGLPPWPAEVPAEEGVGLPPWPAEAPAEVPAEEGAGLPPWLAEAPAEVPAEGMAEVPEEEGIPGLIAEEELELPPWLAEAPMVPEEAAPEALEEVPAVAVPEVPLPWIEEEVPEVPVEVVPEEELYAFPVTPEEEAALPEWARALKPVEKEAAPIPFLEGVELPEWLRAEERPAEEAVEAPAPELAWLERLAGEEVEEEVPALAAVERLPRPPLPPLSPARRQAAELFATLAAAPEPEKRPMAERVPSFSQRLLRWLAQRWPMLALALLMIVMLAANISLPGVRVPVSEAEQAFAAVEKAIAWSPEAGEHPRPVLVAFDWELHRVGEMRPLALVVVRHLLKWKSPVIAVSTTFQGSQLAQEVLETALLEVLPKGNVYGEPGTGQVFQAVEQLVAQGYGDFRNYTYGDHFVNLGLRTGAESALRLLADQPLAWTFPRDFLYGLPSADYPLLQQVRSLEDASLWIVMVGEEDRALGWLEQVISRYPNKPCLLVIPTELGPLVQPYRQARVGAPALLRGVAAAAQYEVLLREREMVSLSPGLSVERRLSLLTVAQFGLVILILAGNLAQLGHWLDHLRKRPPQA